MVEGASVEQRLEHLVAERLRLEERIGEERDELSREKAAGYEHAYDEIQHGLVKLLPHVRSDALRVAIVLEMVRILENRFVYLQNYAVQVTADSRILATIADRFLDDPALLPREILAPIERMYYRGIVALHAGDAARARAAFRDACESEEPDETSDAKFKSFILLGNLLHRTSDYEAASDIHGRAVEFTRNDNIAAQALALKALSVYALARIDEAFELFRQALSLFNRDAPFFNSYFHRNALLFCGLISYRRKEYDQAETYYGQVVDSVSSSSFDYFDALSQLGRIAYRRGSFDRAARYLEQAIETQGENENAPLLDACLWLARAQLRRSRIEEARLLLSRVVTSPIDYERKSEAARLLAGLAERPQ